MEKLEGRIKAGEGTLIGNAGEYYVVAELLKRGIVAALAPRNAPGFDVLATKGRFTTRIRVKTKSDQYNDWQWMAKPDGTLFRDLLDTGDFTVLVALVCGFASRSRCRRRATWPDIAHSRTASWRTAEGGVSA